MTTLTNLYAKHTELELKMDEVTDAIDIEASRLANTVTVNEHNAGTVLTSEDGRSIIVDNRNNSFDATNVYAYNGNKGKLIIGGVSASIHRIKISLAEGIY